MSCLWGLVLKRRTLWSLRLSHWSRGLLHKIEDAFLLPFVTHKRIPDRQQPQNQAGETSWTVPSCSWFACFPVALWFACLDVLEVFPGLKLRFPHLTSTKLLSWGVECWDRTPSAASAYVARCGWNRRGLLESARQVTCRPVFCLLFFSLLMALDVPYATSKLFCVILV